MKTNECVNDATPSGEGYINKTEVARRMSVQVRTVDNWMRRRMIPYYKMGYTVLFRWSEIESHFGQTWRVLADGHKADGPISKSSKKTSSVQLGTSNNESVTNGAHVGVSTRPNFQNSTKEKHNDCK